MDDHLTPLWKESLKRAVCLFHRRQRAEPELKHWHRKAFRDVIHSSTFENTLFSQTPVNEMSAVYKLYMAQFTLCSSKVRLSLACTFLSIGLLLPQRPLRTASRRILRGQNHLSATDEGRQDKPRWLEQWTCSSSLHALHTFTPVQRQSETCLSHTNPQLPDIVTARTEPCSKSLFYIYCRSCLFLNFVC